MIFIFFTILVALIAQMQIFPILGLELDLLLVVTIYYGFLYGWKVGSGVGLVAGILQDIFSFGMLGMAPVGLVICGLLAGYSRRMLILRHWVVRVGLVFVLTVLNMVVYLGVSNMFFQGELYVLLKAKWFVIGIGNAIVSGVVFWLVDRYG